MVKRTSIPANPGFSFNSQSKRRHVKDPNEFTGMVNECKSLADLKDLFADLDYLNDSNGKKYDQNDLIELIGTEYSVLQDMNGKELMNFINHPQGRPLGIPNSFGILQKFKKLAILDLATRLINQIDSVNDGDNIEKQIKLFMK